MKNATDFGMLLGLAYQSFVDELRADLHSRGFDDLGGAYGYVFRILGGEALNLRQLAERLGMTDQGASKIVNEMEARAYIKRHADPDDGRIKRLRLTKRGLAALAAARRFHLDYEQRLIAAIGAKEVAAGRRMLEKVAASGGVPAADARLRAM